MTLLLLWTLLCCSSEVRGQVSVTQPAAVSALPGGSVTIGCRVDPEVYDNIRLAWYLQRDGLPPRLLLYLTRQRASNTSERFTGSGKNTDFTLSIRGVQAEDAGVYYCQSRHRHNGLDVFTRPGGAAQKPAAGGDAKKWAGLRLALVCTNTEISSAAWQ